MSREQLNAAARHFLGRILPTATGKHFTDLNNAEALLGAYRRYNGAAVTAFGRPITPEFVLKVKTGAVAVQGDNPALGTDPVPADAPNHPLIWMRFAADAKADDQATIQDLMGDLDTYVQRKLNLAGVDVSIPDEIAMPANSAQWAQTLQNNRTAVPDNIANLKEVPAPLRAMAPTVSALKLVLSHFFTYDENGAYYPRWAGTGRQIPQDLSEIYKQKSIRELKLMRDQLYVYMLVPKSLFGSGAADAHDYREAVIRLDETGDPSNPFAPTLVHSVYRRIESTSTFHDFIFFEAEDGIGLAVPAAARPKLSPTVAKFLLSIPDSEQDKAQFFHESTHVVEGTPPLVHLTATVQGEVQLPEGVLGDLAEAGAVMSLKSPVDKIMDIAALSSIRYLDLSGMKHFPCLNLASTAVDRNAFQAKFSAAQQDGAGVIVGIIDTGIDGGHPAFNDAAGNSRILAVWEQDNGPANNPNSPKAKHPGNAAYSTFNYGRERTGADVANATDTVGHGTHVAGIAAGASVASPAGNVPSGMAPKANIIMVRAIGVNQGNPADGLKYIFQKAKELGKPCVINMSFENHAHAHDGTDEFARTLTRQLRDAAGNYLKGRVLVAAAGNQRGSALHMRRDLAAGGSVIFRYIDGGPATTFRKGSAEDHFTMWVRPPAPANPKPNLRIAIQHGPTSWTSAATTVGTTPTNVVVPGLNITVTIVYGNKDIHNGDYNVDIGFRSTASPLVALPGDEWRIIVTNQAATSVELHAWSAWMRGGFPGAVASDDAYKIGSPAAAIDVVSVGCSATRLNWPDIDTPAVSRDFSETRLGDITSFSSPGPLRTCSDRLLNLFFLTVDTTPRAIDIAAPGSAIQSALSRQVPTTPASGNRWMMANNNSWFMQGTSMASPLVTGLVACLLAAKPGLTQKDVSDLISGAGRLPNPEATTFDPGHPNPDAWGVGLLNAPSLVKP
ncbi:MAG TPA: S8 family serine peptidase [Candidatus Angelobacter sp.]|nr:S8 family serine peptidase [Candidatus Angelobacter sp.]